MNNTSYSLMLAIYIYEDQSNFIFSIYFSLVSSISISVKNMEFYVHRDLSHSCYSSIDNNNNNNNNDNNNMYLKSKIQRIKIQVLWTIYNIYFVHLKKSTAFLINTIQL